ncbi:MAG: hypothetical protein SFW62_08270 [Alphaproteobacteria bacterium]|nr:hypothetical protein [Alphaproteobacteria bacterium]
MSSENWAGVAGGLSNLVILTTGVAVGDMKSVAAMAVDIVSNVIFFKQGKSAGGYSLGCVLGATSLGILTSSDAVSGNPPLQYLMFLQTGIWSMGGLRYPLNRYADYVRVTRPNMAGLLDGISNSVKVGVSTGSLLLRPLLIAAAGVGDNKRILAAQFLAAAGDFLRGKIRRPPVALKVVPIQDVSHCLRRTEGSVIRDSVMLRRPVTPPLPFAWSCQERRDCRQP